MTAMPPRDLAIMLAVLACSALASGLVLGAMVRLSRLLWPCL